MNKFIAYIFAALILFGVGAFIGIKIQNPVIIPTYSSADSIANVRIDSVKGIYQQVIDSINKVKPKIVERVKYLKEIDTVLYKGSDSSCIEIIERKNKRIVSLDSLSDALAFEARTYSDMLLLQEEKTRLETARFNALSFETDSIISNYKDSITAQRKQYKKRIFWTNVKWGVVSALGIYGSIQLGK